MVSIGIVGGGIIGLATAEAIIEDYPKVKVTVYSDQYSPLTTGDVSAGYFFPYLSGKNDMKKLGDWVKVTIDHIFDLASKNKDFTSAVSLVSGYTFWNRRPNIEDVAASVQSLYGMREVKKEEMKLLTKKRYEYGIFYTTAALDCSRYLTCLMEELKKHGVKFVEKKISSLDQLANLGHDVVVNAAGIGAKFLTDDSDIQPRKGQVLVAKAPWIRHFVVEREKEGSCYIIPKTDHLVVGGTHDLDFSTTIQPDVSKRIWKRACEMLPSLKHGDVVGERVGHRPGRSEVRMEVEHAKTLQGKRYLVLHHYGHGGFGVTVHWGSAKEASKLLQSFLSAHSKL